MAYYLLGAHRLLLTELGVPSRVLEIESGMAKFETLTYKCIAPNQKPQRVVILLLNHEHIFVRSQENLDQKKKSEEKLKSNASDPKEGPGRKLKQGCVPQKLAHHS